MTELALVDESVEAIATHRSAFAARLADLETWFDARRLARGFDALGTQQPFYLAYEEVDNVDLLRRYGSLCDRIAAHWQATQALKLGKRTNNRKVRVGIASAHISRHSVWNALLRGWVQQLDHERFELHLFALGTRDDDETALARSRAASFVQGLSKTSKWAEEILARGLDVLIYPEIGMDPRTAKLAAARLAPVQATTWGHPQTSGLPSMDYYISAEDFEPPDARDFYTEKLVLLPHLGTYYSGENVPPGDVDLAELGVDGSQPVLVCPGTPFKYAPQHDWIYPAIAKQLGRCQLVLFKYPVENLSRQLIRRIESAFASAGLEARDYLVQLPWLNRAQFFGLMRRADIYLDTIGFSGFNTAMQALECSLPIVTREGRFMRGRLASGILRRIGLSDLIVQAEADYVGLAVRLIRDPDLSSRVVERIEHCRTVMYEDLVPIRALEKFLVDAARR
jgi:predicted O-linked N-acetylglucosamine transferase (SPINDLY family)